MSRYRLYTQTEDAPTVNGDQGFVGLDAKTADPAIIAQGMLRVSENARIIGGTPQSRQGVIAALNVNPVSYGRIWGKGIFADPNSIRWVLIAGSNGVWAVADGHQPNFIPLPVGMSLNDECELV